MKKSESSLTMIETDRPVEPARDSLFLRELKQGLLLALGELGYLNDLQLHTALEQLA